MTTNPVTDAQAVKNKVIEPQYANMMRFGNRPTVDIYVDAGASRARRIIENLRSAHA